MKHDAIIVASLVPVLKQVVEIQTDTKPVAPAVWIPLAILLIQFDRETTRVPIHILIDRAVGRPWLTADGCRLYQPLAGWLGLYA